MILTYQHNKKNKKNFQQAFVNHLISISIIYLFQRVITSSSLLIILQQMQEDFDDSILCSICSDIILTPARLNCKHQFCCYCIRSIKYKHKTETINCPLCRKQEKPAGMNKQRGLQVINYVLTHKKEIRILYGEATTINHYDKNETNSKPFFLLLKDNHIHGDIIWGEGSEHSSYLQQVGRVEGKVLIDHKKNIIFQEIKCYYSNSPYQIWSGCLQYKGNGQYQAQKSIYQWHGWGRKSSGDLIINLRELQHAKSLSEQGIK